MAVWTPHVGTLRVNIVVSVLGSAPPRLADPAPAMRVFCATLLAAATVVFAHVVVVLYTGGYRVAVLGSHIAGNQIAGPAILLSVLLIAWVTLRRRVFSLESLSARGAAILFLGFLIIYLANGRTLAQGDTIPARYLPMSILREGNLDLDEFPFLYAPGAWTRSFLEHTEHHRVSAYPVGAALLAVPIYVPSALGTVALGSAFLEQLEKFAAAVIAALSVAILHLVARRFTTDRAALLVTAVYGLGTSTLSVSSQALWQHGPSQLALSVAVYCLVRAREESGWAGLAGFPLAFAVITRPTDILLAIPLALYVIVRHPRQFVTFVGTGLPPAFFQLWYNATYFGTLSSDKFDPVVGGMWKTPLLEGLAGVLLSPSRGLFIYSPVLILSLVGLGLLCRRRGDLLLRAIGLGTIFGILLHSKWHGWWGGHSYGPRLLADLTPGLALLLVPLMPVVLRSRAPALVFLILTLWSTGAHLIGAYVDDGRWNKEPDVDRFQERLWSWRDNQLVNSSVGLMTRVVVATRRLPTSRTAPHLIAASYNTDLPERLTVDVESLIELRVMATNTGQAVWLAGADGEKGQVQFGWRWFDEDGRPVGPEGRTALQTSILPGRSHEFRVPIQPPVIAKRYILECGLVSEEVAWFSDLGTRPIRAEVNVQVKAANQSNPQDR